ncbi:hypothetical protein A2U01_0087752, partial [Trifolium medium]|nr:hypothetical protein [Trifolium medium]
VYVEKTYAHALHRGVQSEDFVGEDFRVRSPPIELAFSQRTTSVRSSE